VLGTTFGVQLPKQQQHAPQMKQAEEVLSLVLPSGRESAPTLEPCEESLDFPPPLVAAQLSAILGTVALRAADPLGSDEVDAALFCETAAQSTSIPRLVCNQSRRQLSYESRVESSLGEHTVESVSSINMDSERKTMAVCNCHDLGCLAGTAPSDAGPPFFAGT